MKQMNPYLQGAGIGLVSMAVAIFGGYACGAQAEQKLKQPATVAYASCADVEAAGKAPLHRGDPGYSAKLDRDGDGTACDQKTAGTMTFAECQASAEYPGGRYAVEYDNGVCTVQKP